MKTYHALVIVPVIPDEDHVVLRIQTEHNGRIGVHMRREVLELFFEHPKTDLLRPLPASDRGAEGALGAKGPRLIAAAAGARDSHDQV